MFKREEKKMTAVHAGCVGIALASCLVVTGMGISMVHSLADDYASEVRAAEQKADNYVISVQNEADRISSELNAEQESSLRQEIEDSEARQQAALEEHIHDVESENPSDADETEIEYVEGMNIPHMGEEGFNEP
jgi:hypothetical protein